MHVTNDLLNKVCTILQRQKQTKTDHKIDKITVFRILTNKKYFPEDLQLDDIKIESVKENDKEFIELVKQINPFFNFKLNLEKLKYYKKYYFITNRIINPVKNLFDERQSISYFSIYDITNQTDIFLEEHKKKGASDQSLFKTFEDAKKFLLEYSYEYNKLGLELKVSIRKHNSIGDVLEETIFQSDEI
jgi:hypothetical protein